MRIARALLCCAAVTLLCSCVGSRAPRDNSAGQVTGEARDRQLVTAATASYLRAKYFGAAFGMRRPFLEQSAALLHEVLSDNAASAKTRYEAEDMLRKVNDMLEASQAAH